MESPAQKSLPPQSEWSALIERTKDHPAFKTAQGVAVERALRHSRPPQKQTSTWKFLVLAALAGFTGGELSRVGDLAFLSKVPPQQGTVEKQPTGGNEAPIPYIAPERFYEPSISPEEVQGAQEDQKPITEMTEKDYSELDNLVGTVEKEIKVRNEVEAFTDNFRAIIAEKNKKFAEVLQVDSETELAIMGAFYSTLREQHLRVDNKDIVRGALLTDSMVNEVFTPEHFPGQSAEDVLSLKEKFITAFRGTDV